MPTLLLESLIILQTFREEDSIQVYIYQIIEILFGENKRPCIKIQTRPKI